MSLLEKLERYFRQHPGTWIDGRVLANEAGFYGWRTQVSRLRQQRSMTIVNRQRPVKAPDGSTAYIISEYKFTPPPAADLIEVIDLAEAESNREAACR